MTWTVIVVEPCLSWLHELRRTDRETLIQISQAITTLAEEGPGLGRPLVDTINGSKYPNMKELRPGSVGATEVRLLFAFDPQRRAIFLVGETKPGNGRNGIRRLFRKLSKLMRSTCGTRRRSEQSSTEQPERALLGRSG
jgi:hypothetical protein